MLNVQESACLTYDDRSLSVLDDDLTLITCFLTVKILMSLHVDDQNPSLDFSTTRMLVLECLLYIILPFT